MSKFTCSKEIKAYNLPKTQNQAITTSYPIKHAICRLELVT